MQAHLQALQRPVVRGKDQERDPVSKSLDDVFAGARLEHCLANVVGVGGMIHLCESNRTPSVKLSHDLGASCCCETRFCQNDSSLSVGPIAIGCKATE